MILEGGMGPMLSKAFLVFGIFWVVAIAVLYFGVGALMSKRRKLLKKQSH